VAELRETVEREVKLSAGEEFVLADALDGEPLEGRTFVSTYHDTSDYRLAASGLTLRHRVENGKGLWQLKLPQGDARLELEAPGGPAAPPDEVARLLPALARGRTLGAVAVLRTRRDGMRVDGTDVVHDSVAVLDGQRVARTFEELEVELVDGDERALRRVEKLLRRAGATERSAQPKLFQALALPYPSEDVAPPGRSAAELLTAALLTQYRQLLAHDPGTRLDRDAEELHQFRVATRRLRAFLRAGRPLLERSWADALRDEIGWLGGALGPVRDLDVLLEYLRAETAQLESADAEAAGELLAAFGEERVVARAELEAALTGDRYLALLDRLEAAGDAPLTGDGADLDEVWSREHRRLRSAVKALGDEPDDAGLHAARIKVKRARYAGELTGRDGYVKAAKRLQDILGEHQDAVVAEERLRALAVSATAPAALAAGQLVERQRARRRRARDTWRDAWAQLAKQAAKAA
jgi:CHAD domain-containing protein